LGEGKEALRMKRRRHTPEQIVRKLGEADAALSAGISLGQVC
jgi:hypothetical protein